MDIENVIYTHSNFSAIKEENVISLKMDSNIYNHIKWNKPLLEGELLCLLLVVVMEFYNDI